MVGMRKRQSEAKSGRPLSGRTVQSHQRGAVGMDDFGFPPDHVRESPLTENLAQCFLGREACRVRRPGIGLPPAIVLFVVRKKTLREARLLRFDGCANPRDFDQIGTDEQLPCLHARNM